MTEYLKTKKDIEGSDLWTIYKDANPSNQDKTTYASISAFLKARRWLFQVTDTNDSEYYNGDPTFLDDKEELQTILDIIDIEPTTQLKNNHLKALSKICATMGFEPAGVLIKQRYMDSSAELKQGLNNGTIPISDRDRRYKTSTDELVSLLSYYKADYLEHKNKPNGLKRYMSIQNYAIFLLYLTMPPRRNIYSSVIVSTMDDRSHNILLIKQKKPLYFIFNKQKNSTMNGQIVPIANEAQRVLGELIPLLRTKYLFVNQYGQPFTNWTYHINQLTEKAIGHRLSSTAFRKHYHSDPQFKDQYEKKKRDAYLMGHSLPTSQQYYNRY
tara:strand:+ start:1218 stop:2198 length:981 start_codon:yes stop_codon:yes gene_type:complete